MLTGLHAARSDLFFEFVRAEPPTPMPSKLRAMLMATDVIPSDSIRALVRSGLFKLAKSGYTGVANSIPTPYISFFRTRLKDQLEKRPTLGSGVTSIFDWLVEAGESYEYVRPSPGEEQLEMGRLIRRVEDNSLPSLYVLHPVSLDLLGHRYGPESFEVMASAKRLDNCVRRTLSAVVDAETNLLCIVMSDHGMLPVTGNFDPAPQLRAMELTHGQDYLCFLDSTAIRFWCLTEESRTLIPSSFRGPGHFLTDSELRSVHALSHSRINGDLFFALDEGRVVFPDFFRRSRAPRGMHGYFAQRYDNPVALVGTSNSVEFEAAVRRCAHVDLARLLVDHLGFHNRHPLDGETIGALHYT